VGGGGRAAFASVTLPWWGGACAVGRAVAHAPSAKTATGGRTLPSKGQAGGGSHRSD